ncbi:MAG: GDSL-type esterase/lipase family protein [Cyclobacteriaceae bacterium]|nr:GDSL-type esterase/lipase family protein [Cyclobacteriaceae bacterium]MDX5467419.1 GDSL-type esterase/lipase family protein [Cyclobacteriaceae bacterium]
MKDPRIASIFLSIFFWSLGNIQAQEVPFEKEVRQISAKYDSLGWAPGSTVFTGSSTIRMWNTLEETFAKESLINTGFGGSKASDLERHLFPLVIKFEPSRVFIYEGDNDLWADVEVSSILTSLDNIVTRIHLINPEVEIYLIGAKPSPSRWEKKANYQIFNQKLSEYCRAKENVEFVDVWKALTTSDGNPRPELYLQDQLHLNQEGYVIWAGIFEEYFKD